MPAISTDTVPPIQARHKVLWLRIGVLLVVVIALVLVLISYLNYANYRKTCLDLNLSRYMIVAKDLRQTVLTGLNVGLDPTENNRLLPAIKALARRDSGIRFIAVFDEADAVIGVGAQAAPVPPAWRASLAATAPDSFWRASDAASLQIGIPFVNNFGVKAGAVVIGYDRAAIEAAASAMLRKLVADVLLTMVFLAVLAFGGVYLFTRRFSSVLAQVAGTIGSALAAGPPGQIGEPFLGPGVARDINDFTMLSHRLVREIGQLEQGLTGSGRAGATGCGDPP